MVSNSSVLLSFYIPFFFFFFFVEIFYAVFLLFLFYVPNIQMLSFFPYHVLAIS